MPVTGIDHVQVAAPPGCEPEARRFYGELLGMEEVEKPEELKKRGGVWFQCGRQQLHVGVQEDFRPSSKAHPAFAVTGLDEMAQTLPVAWDGPRCYLKDPWGNRIELLAT